MGLGSDVCDETGNETLVEIGIGILIPLNDVCKLPEGIGLP